MKHDIFENELSTFENERVRKFAELLLDNAPDYFYEVAASSSGRFHPAYALGEGGLVRHTKATLRFLNHMLTIEQNANLFTSLERDCMRAALLYHDGEKQGDGEKGSTVFDHPLIAASTIRSYIDNNEFVENEIIDLIADSVESHMGQWNSNKTSKFVLPKPETEMQKMTHLCDYFASRKDIEVLFDGDSNVAPQEKPDPATYKMPFGKYKDKPFSEVAKCKGYLRWLTENTKLQEPLKTLVSEALNG